MSLRLRLLVAFALVSVPPLAILTLALAERTERLSASAALETLDRSVRAAAARARTLETDAGRRLAGASAASLESDPDAALAALGADHDLELAELVGSGRVRASLHWRAGIDLPDDDEPFGEGPFRVESVAAGFDRARRLAVTAERPLDSGEQPLLLRGGFLVDGEWLAEAEALSGVALAWRDTRRGRWYPEQGAHVEWDVVPAAPGSGRAGAGRASALWRAVPVAPGLLLVGSVPRAPLLALVDEQRRLLVLAVAGALLAALLGAVWLAERLSRPVRDLADEVTRLGGSAGPLPSQPWDELNQLARAFDDAAADLRESSGRLRQAERIAEWREMARRLAHELKNPLFPMQVSVETLRRAFERRGDEADPDLARLADDTTAAVLAQIQALRRVVEDFSAFARMPRPRPAPVDVVPLLERVATLQRGRSAGAAVEVDATGAPDRIVGDAGLLERALGNLVSNALDVLGGGGRVVLRARRERDEVCLEVEDDGPGLDAEERARIFTPYYTTRESGTGLGLPIVSAIAADHGGRVEVASEPGRGARFAIRIPRRGTTPGADGGAVESAGP